MVMTFNRFKELLPLMKSMKIYRYSKGDLLVFCDSKENCLIVDTIKNEIVTNFKKFSSVVYDIAVIMKTLYHHQDEYKNLSGKSMMYRIYSDVVMEHVFIPHVSHTALQKSVMNKILSKAEQF